MEKQHKSNERWKMLIANLREKAIAKWGVGWQTKLAESTTFTQSNVSRMFGLKYTPSLKNYTILSEAIGIKNTEGLYGSVSKFLVCIDKTTNEMYILHREDPCYLVHVRQEIPLRFVLIESYDANWNDERLLLHPSITELKIFAKKLFSCTFDKN